MAIDFQPLDQGNSKIDFQPLDQSPSSQGGPSNAGLEAIAQPIRNAGNAVAPYASQVASQPDVQPFQGMNPFSKPQGGPVQQVLGSMRQLYSLPLRFSATLGQASQPVAEATATGLGSMGANPYASAAAGMVAGAAVDPRSWVPGSQEMPKGAVDLPVVEPGAKTGDPHALFAYPEQLGPNYPKENKFNVFGDPNHPAIKARGWGSSVSEEDLQKAGIPITGRQPSSLKYGPVSGISNLPDAPQSFLSQRAGVSYPHSDTLPDKVAQARAMRTGVPARQFQALYKDPSAIFAGGNTEQAGADIGAAKASAGINPGVTNDISSLTPDNIERINPTKAIKLDDINTVLGKIQSKQPPTPQEAQNALGSVNSILGQPSVQNDRDVFRQWTAIKTHINNALGEVSPDVRSANQAFAREKLGETFSSMNALNKSGSPSKLGAMAQTGMAGVGALLGHIIPGVNTIEGGAVGAAIGKYGNQFYHAPYVAGLQTAAGSLANKAIDPLLTKLEQMGSSPAAQAYVARYLQQRGNQ